MLSMDDLPVRQLLMRATITRSPGFCRNELLSSALTPSILRAITALPADSALDAADAGPGFIPFRGEGAKQAHPRYGGLGLRQ